MYIQQLQQKDIPAAMNLSQIGGWNQISADWKRVLALNPDGCLAGWINGNLVATAIVTTVGEVSWIGMMLVHPKYRQQGYGTKIFHAVLAKALEHSPLVGLDANNMGRSIYQKAGFERAMYVTQWSGTLTSCNKATSEVSQFQVADLIVDYDKEICGQPRDELLEYSLSEPDVTGFIIKDNGTRGYALLRPKYNCQCLGPILADTTDYFGLLLDAVSNKIDDTVIMTNILGNNSTMSILRKRGLTLQRRLIRMTYSAPQPLLYSERVRAAFGFDWG